MAPNNFAIVNPKVDALILTALKDELDAVLAFAPDGRASWQASKDAEGCLYFVHDFDNERGGMRVARHREHRLHGIVNTDCTAS